MEAKHLQAASLADKYLGIQVILNLVIIVSIHRVPNVCTKLHIVHVYYNYACL